MTTDRCPACGAAVTQSAQWCTLCYASLRAPEPVAIADSSSSSRTIERLAVDTLLVEAPVLTVADARPLAPAGWPCHACGATVPLADDTCSSCGAGFLPADPRPSLHLPGVGDVGRFDKTQRVMLMVGGVLVVTVVLVLLAFVAGSVL